MIGYHILPWDTWLKVQEEGLIPQPINKKDVDYYLPEGTEIIWIWKDQLVGLSLMGTLVYQMGTKRKTTLAMIEVSFLRSDRFVPDNPWFKPERGDHLMLSHDGTFVPHGSETWAYHVNEPAFPLCNKIPPTQLRLIYQWNLVSLVQMKKGAYESTCDWCVRIFRRLCRRGTQEKED